MQYLKDSILKQHCIVHRYFFCNVTHASALVWRASINTWHVIFKWIFRSRILYVNLRLLNVRKNKYFYYSHTIEHINIFNVNLFYFISHNSLKKPILTYWYISSQNQNVYVYLLYNDPTLYFALYSVPI